MHPMTPRLRTMILPALMLLGFATAEGGNFRWLDSAPVRHFTERDWQLLGDTAELALTVGRDGQRFEWRNPDSGSEGSLEPSAAGPAYDDRECRRLKIENRARGDAGSSVYTFCKQADGSWKIVR